MRVAHAELTSHYDVSVPSPKRTHKARRPTVGDRVAEMGTLAFAGKRPRNDQPQRRTP